MTLALVFLIFAVNVYLHRPILESSLFSLALAVGLTPQLLPAIISINLAHGAIRSYKQPDVAGYEKADEVPHDFIRKHLSILATKDGVSLVVTKGPLPNVIDICSKAESPSGEQMDMASVKLDIQQKFEALNNHGFRLLGIAYRDMGAEPRIDKDCERDMTFLGYLVFFDPPKADIAETIDRLRQLGISLKIITGDSRLVARKVSQDVEMADPRIVTGSELRGTRKKDISSNS